MTKGMDGKPVSQKDPVGYDAIPFPSRDDRPPMQHSGWRPEQLDQVDAQNAKFRDDAPLLVPNVTMDGADVTPPDGASSPYGAGNLDGRPTL